MKNLKSPNFIKIIILATALSTLTSIPAFAVNKVSYDAIPTSALNAGETVTVVFRLDEPIICPDTCTALTLQLASSDTATAYISQNNLTWNSIQWSETRTIQISVGQSLTYGSSSSVRFQGKVQSNAEYYRNYQVTLTLSINTPVKPLSIPDPKQRSMITERPNGRLSDSSTTVLQFKGSFVEEIRAIHFNGLPLQKDKWSFSDTLITIEVPSSSSERASIQIYNGAVPVLFDDYFEVLKTKSNATSFKRVRILCKGKRFSRTIYGIAPTCPVGFTLSK